MCRTTALCFRAPPRKLPVDGPAVEACVYREGCACGAKPARIEDTEARFAL